MNKQTIITILFALVAVAGQGQSSFDVEEGCLNVIDVTLAQGVGEYGDKCISANYLHEKFINERFSIGPGIGYSHHNNYNFSAIPVFLSTHYFFLDKRFSPFVNLRVGLFALFNAKNVGSNEKYSLSKEKQGFSLFMSPSIGVKMHITPNIGIMASISDEAYLVNAFDTNRNDYKSRLIHSMGINVGVCFHIKGW
ncbi:MAG: hypothetical protein IJ902_08215 [Prevotella sp.]|nr:hypothetical protein [Prevotella sp.]